METWQKLRLDRARQQEIVVTHVECTDNSLIFCIQGMSDEYLVEVEQDADLWPPRCSCEDNYWRPDALCKHILICLKLMGFCDTDLENYGWEGPEQNELNEHLCTGPSCVGVSLESRPGNNINIEVSR